MVDLFRQYKVFIIITCILMGANIIFYFFAVSSSCEKIGELQETYIKKRKTGAINNNCKSRRFYAALKSIDAFREQLPAATRFFERIGDLDDVFKKNRLSASKMIFKPVKSKKISIWRYSTSFTARGGYADLRKMLSDLQSLPGLFCIERIALVNRSEDTEEIDMSLRLSTYFR